MKKRFLAVFAALALCVGLMASTRSAGATDTPHFVACNDNLLLLKEWHIPIIADGMYYIPYQVLDVSSTTVNLGVYPVYNAAIRTLTIYNREKVIAFDLATGICSDRDGVILSARAVTRNGQIYVPAKFICEYFGLTYSYFPQTKFGPMIRICSSSARLRDSDFVAAAQLQMEDRLNEWRKSQNPTPTPTPTTTPPATTTTRPTTSAPPTATPTTTPTAPVVNKSDVRTYLAFRADQVDGLDGLLNRLEQHQIRALFFFPADELARYDEAVRRVLCEGHGIGLLISGSTAGEMAGSAAEGNRILRQIAHLHTYTVLPPEGTDADTLLALREGGLLPWSTDVDSLPNGQSVIARSSEVLEKVETYTETVYILSDCSASGSVLMARLLIELVEARYDLRLAVETEI